MSNKKSARVVWKGTDLNFAGQLGSGYIFDMGSGEHSTGGSPMEFLLAGVAGCTSVDVVHILRKQRQPVTGLTVEITGVRANQHPQVFTDVQLHFVVQGQGVSPQAVARAIKLSEEKYCSASAMFQRAGVRIHSTYEVHQVPVEEALSAEDPAPV